MIEKDSSQEPEQPYKLYQDPLLLERAPGDRFLAAKLDHLEQAERFAERGLAVFEEMRNLAKNDLTEYVKERGYETSVPLPKELEP
jgi:hypothetical protein